MAQSMKIGSGVSTLNRFTVSPDQAKVGIGGGATAIKRSDLIGQGIGGSGTEAGFRSEQAKEIAIQNQFSDFAADDPNRPGAGICIVTTGITLILAGLSVLFMTIW